MKSASILVLGFVLGAAVAMVLGQTSRSASEFEESGEVAAEGVPTFKVDISWPKPLPNNWILGNIGGITVDRRDHIWVLHRPDTLTNDERGATLDPPLSECCVPAPSVIEFDPEGNVVQAWGGEVRAEYIWPAYGHGISVDHEDNVWITGAGPKSAGNHQVLKFTRDGRFLMRIGYAGERGSSRDTERLGEPAQARLDPETNELFIADGHINRRLIVFDGRTGAFKRLWGAYGEQPDDAPVHKFDPDAAPERQFAPNESVHCVKLDRSGLVYVCDRGNNRVQIFRKDGSFVKEFFVARRSLGTGSVADIDFSPDQKFIYVADSANQRVSILLREQLEIVGSFGRHGHQAGQFHWIHSLATNSKGDIYTGESNGGKRVQKFVASH